MAKKLIALILSVMLVLSLMTPVFAVETPAAATAADNRSVTVGVIGYLTNELGFDGWQVHYWGGASGANDANMNYAGTTEQKDVGYWDSAQSFNMFTADIPADATGFKVHNGDRWFGDDGTAGKKAYVFNYDGDKALYEDDDQSTVTASYVKVTEDLSDWSGEYLIVYEDGGKAFNGALSSLDASSNTINVTISDGTIASNAVTDGSKFTIAACDGGYSIRSASGKYISSNGDSNSLKLFDSAVANSIDRKSVV